MHISHPDFCLCAAALMLATGVASGQAYPSKPIRIMTSAAGGANDALARIAAQGITEPLGQPVIVDNRGAIAMELVAKSPADGYTLLLFGPPLWVGPLLQSMPYDVVRDYVPVSLLVRNPNMLVVHPSVPVKSVKELVALAKAKPGQLNYSSASLGGSTHLAAELFKSLAKVNIVHVPYKGGGPALTDLLAGHVQLTFDGTNLVPHVKSGKLRALAVTTLESSALFPELPTVASSGLPGYEAVAWHGVFAPAKTPDAIVRRLNQELVRATNAPDTKTRLLGIGLEPVASSSEEFGAKVRAEIAKWSKVIKEANIKAD